MQSSDFFVMATGRLSRHLPKKGNGIDQRSVAPTIGQLCRVVNHTRSEEAFFVFFFLFFFVEHWDHVQTICKCARIFVDGLSTHSCGASCLIISFSLLLDLSMSPISLLVSFVLALHRLYFSALNPFCPGYETNSAPKITKFIATIS